MRLFKRVPIAMYSLPLILIVVVLAVFSQARAIAEYKTSDPQAASGAGEQMAPAGFTEVPGKDPVDPPLPRPSDPPGPGNPPGGNVPERPQKTPSVRVTSGIGLPAAPGVTPSPYRAVSPTPVGATPAACKPAVRYMVKFVCGLQKPLEGTASGGLEPPVKPGNYATAINLHNYTDANACGTLRPSLPYTLGATQVPPIFSPTAFDVAPYSVVNVDCNTIWKATGIQPGTFIEGMLEIGVGADLPAVAVYTSALTDQMGITKSGAGISIDVEYLEPFGR